MPGDLDCIEGRIAEEATKKPGMLGSPDAVRPMQAFAMAALGVMLPACVTTRKAGPGPAPVEDALRFVDWQARR